MEKIFYNLTNPQKSIYLTEQYYSNTSINNILGTAVISEKVDFSKLEQAINIVIQKNDNLKIKLIKQDDTLKQYIDNFEFTPIEIKNLKNEEDLKLYEDSLVRTPINFEEKTYEFKIFRFPDNTGGFFLNIHHIVADSWTMGLTCIKIIKEYYNLTNKLDKFEETINPSYIDYINSENDYLNSERYLIDKEYWNNVFSEIPNSISIPGSFYTHNTFDCAANRENFTIPKELVDTIQSYCKKNKASVFNFFMAVLAIYMYKINNTKDFVIGTPILNRTNFKEKNTCGMFINVAPLKINIDSNNNFLDFLNIITKDSKDLLKHQKYSYNNILNDLREKDASVPNLYNVILSYQITKANAFSEINYNTHWAFNGTCLNDINIQIYDLNETNNLNISYDYKKNKYSKNDIQTIHQKLLYIIEQLLKETSTDINIENIDIILPEEKNILSNINTEKSYNFDKTFIEIFEENVKKSPNAIAIIDNEIEISYSQLNKLSNQIAHFLKNKNIKQNSTISVSMQRKYYLIASILGILKLGCNYLPIFPEYPTERIEYILNDSKSSYFLTDFDINFNFKKSLNITTTNLELFNSTNLNNKINPEDLAYIIYTSGSTGQPKGVMIKHSNLLNFLYCFNDQFNNKFSHNDKCLSLTNISFDVSVCEIFTPLMFGSTLVLYPENTLTNIPLLCNILNRHQITFLYLPPSLLLNTYKFINDNNYKIFINKLLVGVEPIKNKTLNNFYNLNEKLEIVNGYGPTETTICCTFFKHKKTSKNLENNIVPIGKTLSNNELLILNDNLKQVSLNSFGEIYISGKNICKGYFNNLELTNKSFITLDNKLFYKTGDIAKINFDGNIEFKGRNDSQIKFKGNRIELNEINLNIQKVPGVNNCITLIQSINNNEYLCSYITTNKNINQDNIKNHLKNILPHYMIPTHIMILDKIPLTANGKIDKKALPEIIIENNVINEAASNTEKFISNFLKSVLSLKQIDIYENIFTLGVDSLIAIQLISEIYSHLNKKIYIQDVFKNNSIHELANFIDNTSIEENIVNIFSTKKANFYPITSAQKRIYYSSNITNNNAYNMTGGIEFFEEININKIEKYLNTLIDRHEAFRTQFEFQNGEIVQNILSSAKIKLEYMEKDNKNLNDIINEFDTHFDLSKAPLIRAKIIKFEDNHYLLLISIHHIIADGTSFNTFIKEFCKLYNNESLEALSLTYKDYAVYENNKLQTAEINKDKEYWTTKLNKKLPVLNLPTTHNRPTIFTYVGSKINKTISKTIYKNIQDLCIEHNITPFMFMLAAYYIILYKYSDNNEILIGTPVANRDLPNVSNIIGMFVNTLVLEGKINKEISFIEFCNQVKNESLEAFKHSSYPFNELVKNLNIKRDLSRNILFDTMFTYQNNGMPEINIFKNTKYFIPDTKIAKYDLSLEVIPDKSTYTLNFEYCTDLFSKQFINTFAEQYIETIKNIVNNPNEKIKNINILSEADKNKIIYEFNDTKLKYPSDATLPKLFEKQVLKTPEKIAAVFENISLTYSEINKKINNLAYYLTKQNIKHGDIVGILLNRSIEMLIAMMAILKVGATYVPIDPTYPEERVQYILENSKTKLILSETKLQDKFILNCPIINAKLDNKEIYNSKHTDNLITNFESSDLAYIIYTSGSTGKPKGVILTHKNVINFIYGVMDKIKFSQNLNMVSLTTICFDIFVLESLLPMCTGITTVIANSQEQTVPQSLNALCLKNNVKILQTTPSKLMLLISNENSLEYVKNLEYILVGGEAVPSNLVKKLKKLSNAKIFNMYGPTETTVWSTIKDLTSSNIVTIGTPIANTYTYILDDNNQVLPIGVNGNLFIGGDGVGKGYLNRPDLTDEKFIDNPFVPGTKMYNTGDIARLTSNGDIVYSGRSDFQVKIHGLRIELGEIEKQISSYPGISNTAVCVKKDLSERDMLCAYFMADKLININKLKEYLKTKIPVYMIPIYFKQMEDFEYTPNGKIDRRNLPNPEFINSVKEIVAPETETEKLLTKILEKILAITPISITDNIFDIGADSLTALRLQIELLNEHINIPYADIFKFNTIKDLSLRIDSNISSEVTPQNKDYDYEKINELISKNNKEALKNIEYHPIENVILTGATGFLGAHILQELMDNYNIKIYCLVRPPLTGGDSIEEKLKNKLRFYFGNKYDHEIGRRIVLIHSDMTNENLGLSEENYNLLKNNCKYIINSAANVKHYGYYSEFERINVFGVKNLIKFALAENMKFIQISTTSVSGNTLVGEKSKLNNFDSIKNYTEDKLFVGQSFENVYTYSKFEAEKLVLENIINNNLDGLILRVGYITPRYSDGVFQINKKENALFNRIQTFITLNCMPESLRHFLVEFTPVDYLAKSIIKTIEYYNKSFNILHLYNPNHIIIEDLVKYISKNASIIPDEDFRKLIEKTLQDPNKRYIISSIVNDMDSEFNLIYTSDIRLNNNLTTEFLNKTGFKWPMIDKKYIELILYLFEL